MSWKQPFFHGNAQYPLDANEVCLHKDWRARIRLKKIITLIKRFFFLRSHKTRLTKEGSGFKMSNLTMGMLFMYQSDLLRIVSNINLYTWLRRPDFKVVIQSKIFHHLCMQAGNDSLGMTAHAFETGNFGKCGTKLIRTITYIFPYLPHISAKYDLLQDLVRKTNSCRKGREEKKSKSLDRQKWLSNCIIVS